MIVYTCWLRLALVLSTLVYSFTFYTDWHRVYSFTFSFVATIAKSCARLGSASLLSLSISSPLAVLLLLATVTYACVVGTLR